MGGVNRSYGHQHSPAADRMTQQRHSAPTLAVHERTFHELESRSSELQEIMMLQGAIWLVAFKWSFISSMFERPRLTRALWCSCSSRDVSGWATGWPLVGLLCCC